MPGTIEVKYSDYYLVNGLVFKPPFEYRFAFQMTETIVADIWVVTVISLDGKRREMITVLSLILYELWDNFTVQMKCDRERFIQDTANEMCSSNSKVCIISKPNQ